MNEARPLTTVVVAGGSTLWRIHRAEHSGVWFGPAPGQPPVNRFDAPDGRYRTCYLGDSPEVSFAETLIRQPRTRFIDRRQLEDRRLSRLTIRRPLRLVRFHGPGLVRLGIGADVAHGEPYDRCRQIAAEIWSHPGQVDGMEYRSRWDNDRLCIALFDRAEDALDSPGDVMPLMHPPLLDSILRLYGIGVI